MTTLDWVTIALYFGLLAGLTGWSVARNRDTADDYFLAGRNLGSVVVGASIFASNIGSEHLVGLAGAGATSGVTLAHFELHACQNGYTSGSWLWILNNIYFQYYGVLIFVVSVAVLIVVSYATPPPRAHQLTGLTYATVTSEQRRESRRSWNHWDVINSTAVLLLISAAYIYFNG